MFNENKKTQLGQHHGDFLLRAREALNEGALLAALDKLNEGQKLGGSFSLVVYNDHDTVKNSGFGDMQRNESYAVVCLTGRQNVNGIGIAFLTKEEYDSAQKRGNANIRRKIIQGMRRNSEGVVKLS
jgi:hypothetical protein